MNENQNITGVMEQETQENIDSTTAVEEQETEQTQPEEKAEEQVEKTFTQEQVNEMIRARLEKRQNSIFSRYGVKDKNELDELVGKSQSYDIMKERYDELKAENSALKEKLAFVNNNISADREDDVRAYFKGKELDFNEDALVKELETHPEWRKVIEQKDESPKTTIKVLGVEHRDKNVPETEAEKMSRIFGV